MTPPVRMVSHLPYFDNLLILAAIIVCGLGYQALMNAFPHYVRQRTYNIFFAEDNTHCT